MTCKQHFHSIFKQVGTALYRNHVVALHEKWKLSKGTIYNHIAKAKNDKKILGFYLIETQDEEGRKILTRI